MLYIKVNCDKTYSYTNVINENLHTWQYNTIMVLTEVACKDNIYLASMYKSSNL